MKPKLSVIIASYNHQDYIAETLQSLETQTFQDFEVTIVDDGSTDRTVEIARMFSSRARVYIQENLGVVAARNRGVGMAKGEYVCLVDSDDLVLPDRFEKQVALLDRDMELGLVFGDAWIIDSQGTKVGKFSDVYPVVRGDVAEMLVLHYCFAPTITVMVRTDVLRRAGPFEKPGPISDYMKWIEIAHLSKVFYQAEPLGCWRRHERSVSKQADKERSYAMTRIALRKVLRKQPLLRAKVGRKVLKRFSMSYFLTGFWLAAEGNVERARKYYCKAVKANRLSVRNWVGILLAYLPPKRLVTRLHRYLRAKKLPW